VSRSHIGKEARSAGAGHDNTHHQVTLDRYDAKPVGRAANLGVQGSQKSAAQPGEEGARLPLDVDVGHLWRMVGLHKHSAHETSS
jgi:hypothetical protein